MKYVILSFDYELFFGDKSGTVKKSLIEPTNKLMDCMEQCGFRGNFFVDWQMLKYLKETKTKMTDADYFLIEAQLQDMIRRGHRIELHIHPHWVDAKYNGDGTWDFSDFTHYSLNSFKEEEIIMMFEEGVELLTGIARSVVPDYKIVAFRAGGWAVQPFDTLKKAFEKTGIFIDSSVMRGSYAENEGSYYDFRNAPFTQRGFYRFEDDVCCKVEKGQFVEVPISNVKIGLLYKIIGRIYTTLFGKIESLTDGTHQRSKTNKYTKKNKAKILSLTLSRVNPINVIINQLKCRKDVSCYIDHPKDFTNVTEMAFHALSIMRKKSLFYNDILSL